LAAKLVIDWEKSEGNVQIGDFFWGVLLSGFDKRLKKVGF
jgi:hypothetical protein